MHVDRPNQSGFVLAVVLVFLVVLALTAFLAASLTRTDLQVVTNIGNEKRAFYLAEAGVTEALLRLETAPGTPIAVGGSTFDPAIAPNVGNSQWKGYILFSGTGPVTTGTPPVLTTPTVQSPTSRLLYSTTAVSTGALRLEWQTVTVGGVTTIKKTADGKNILDIVSTGVSGPAQRTVTVSVKQNPALPSILTSATGCNQGISMNGTTNLSVAGTIQVNGACNGAISGVGAAQIAAAGAINVVGGVNMQNPPTPAPTTGVSPISDPLAGLLPPCFGSVVANCQMLTTSPVQRGTAGPTNPTTQVVTGGTLSPGIYYGGLEIRGGNVTMQPGVYIMAGGGFTAWNNTLTLNASGVVIYSTQNDNPAARSGAGAFGAFTISQNANVNLISPSAGPYSGIAVFQDRSNTQPVHLQGGSGSGTLDGVVYAINSDMDLQGSYTLNANFIVHTLSLIGGSVMQPPTNVTITGGGTWEQIAWKDF